MKSHSKPMPLRFLPILLLVILLAFPSLSIQGAANGLLLWFNVVLPTLAPFIICTQTVILFDGVQLLTRPFYPLFHTIFGLTVSGSYVLLCGLLCGYPLGAKLCADFYSRGEITKKEAQYLLSICNHPSPMFLLGFVRGQLPAAVPAALLLACLYLPVLPISWISRTYSQSRFSPQTSLTACEYDAPSSPPVTLESILLSTAETMVLIGSYIMLFSILAAWIGRFSIIPVPAQAVLSGIAEITTGIHRICQTFPEKNALLPVIGVVAFGGLSGIFQTRSVIKNAGLSIRHYVFWKLLHAAIACLILTALQTLPPALLHW